MKTYSTCEVIKNIGESFNLRYQSKFLGSDEVIWEAFSRNANNAVRCIYGKGTDHQSEDFLTTDATTMNLKWELVQQPVPAMEALKAYDSGKTIYCVHGLVKTIYKPSREGMVDGNNVAISVGEILRGTWFIEEEE